MKWTGRVVILDDESTTYEDLKDWLLDYYDIAAEYPYAVALSTHTHTYER